GDEQTARGAGHGKTEAFQHMGRFPNPKSHGGTLPVAVQELTLTAVGKIPMRTSAQAALQEIVSGRAVPPYRAPNLVLPNSAFWPDGCERQYCGGAVTSP